MFSALLKFALPLSVTGTGAVIALGASYSNSEKNNVSTTIPLVNQNSHAQEASLPNIESSSPDLESSLFPVVSHDSDLETPSGITEHTVTEVSAGDVEHSDSRQELEAESQSPTLPEVSLVTKLEPEANCQIIQPVMDVFKSISKNSEDYYTVSCKNQRDETFAGEWKWLFLKTLFSEKDGLNIGDRFDIDVVTSDMGVVEDEVDETTEYDEDNLFGITLSSPNFVNNELKGRWNYGSVGEEDGAIINLSPSLKSEKIYLF